MITQCPKEGLPLRPNNNLNHCQPLSLPLSCSLTISCFTVPPSFSFFHRSIMFLGITLAFILPCSACTQTHKHTYSIYTQKHTYTHTQLYLGFNSSWSFVCLALSPDSPFIKYLSFYPSLSRTPSLSLAPQPIALPVINHSTAKSHLSVHTYLSLCLYHLTPLFTHSLFLLLSLSFTQRPRPVFIFGCLSSWLFSFSFSKDSVVYPLD